MDGSSLFVVAMPITTLISLFTGIARPFIAASRPGRSRVRRPGARADELKRIGAAGRKARPPKPGSHHVPAEYLYLPCVHTPSGDYSADTRGWIQEVPIVKKTAQLIYYTSDTWDRREVVVSPGCISREQFETDTRCPARGGCGEDCPADTRGWRCAQHGYTWEHCPHGEDRCRHGYPAGVIPVPGDHHRPGPARRLFFATREAAEADLYRGERGRAEPAAREAPSIKELRRAMADAHPDRGGTAEQFMAAGRRYQTARQLARR